jgi:DNA-binding SARP family transcriptional activator
MLRFRLLGPLEVVDDGGGRVDIGGRQPRTLLAVLLVAEGRRVTLDAVVDALWGDDPPASATGTVQSYVSRLRRRFGDERLLTWDEAGYRLDVTADQVDARRFEAMAEHGRARLAEGRAAEARAVLVEAEELWRGPALAEFADLEFAVGYAARLEQRRLAAV